MNTPNVSRCHAEKREENTQRAKEANLYRCDTFRLEYKRSDCLLFCSNKRIYYSINCCHKYKKFLSLRYYTVCAHTRFLSNIYIYIYKRKVYVHLCVVHLQYLQCFLDVREFKCRRGTASLDVIAVSCIFANRRLSMMHRGACTKRSAQLDGSLRGRFQAAFLLPAARNARISLGREKVPLNTGTTC